MKLPLASTILLVCAVTLLGQSPVLNVFRVSETVRMKGTDEKHQAKLVIRTAGFDPKRHRIVRQDSQGKSIRSDAVATNSVTWIDGRRPLGVGNKLPDQQVESMSVSFDGVQIEVPKRFFADCFNPNFSADYWGTRLSDNGASLLIFMAGGHDKTLYQVIWILRKDRQHARFFNNCPECDYRDILSFFKEK